MVVVEREVDHEFDSNLAHECLCVLTDKGEQALEVLKSYVV